MNQALPFSLCSLCGHLRHPAFPRACGAGGAHSDHPSPFRVLSWQMQMAKAPGVPRPGGQRGLSLLVQQVLGKPLDKSQQLSNWDRRPLREGQLIYAGVQPPIPALLPPRGPSPQSSPPNIHCRLNPTRPTAADAYCLLEVHRVLCREPGRFHLTADLTESMRPGQSDRSASEVSGPPRQVRESPSWSLVREGLWACKGTVSPGRVWAPLHWNLLHVEAGVWGRRAAPLAPLPC